MASVLPSNTHTHTHTQIKKQGKKMRKVIPIHTSLTLFSDWQYYTVCLNTNSNSLIHSSRHFKRTEQIAMRIPLADAALEKRFEFKNNIREHATILCIHERAHGAFVSEHFDVGA